MAKVPPRLRVVPAPPQYQPVTRATFEAAVDQRSLFVHESPSLLIFAKVDGLSQDEFYRLIVKSKPKLVLDLRVAPRFDIGTMSRKAVFALFDSIGSRYVDVSGILEIKQARDARLNPSFLGQQLKEIVFKGKTSATGPLLLLSDAAQTDQTYVDALSSAMDSLCEGGWETMRFPQTPMAKIDDYRNVIFLSHATPDDNEFARWLSAQLLLAGYEVWTDFNRLTAGEYFWDTIETVIRENAAKVVVAASGLAQVRSGVLDEINLAVSVERSLGLDGFVIPLRIDDTPFGEFRANLLRRNIIDFHGNWAAGLSNLLHSLATSNVPKGLGDTSGIAQTVHHRVEEKVDLVDSPDPVFLNWAMVESLPGAIGSFEIGGPFGKLATLEKTAGFPLVTHEDTVLTFASANHMQAKLPAGLTCKRRASSLTKEFLKGNSPEFPRIAARESRKILSNLLRQGWDRHAGQRGLFSFELASRSNAWYLPNDAIPGNQVQYVDYLGKRRRKLLVGFSEKRGVFWHFALEFRVGLGDPLRFSLRPHVIFSSDGRTPVANVARMHALRRGFCKTWWNDRWRDLTVAYLSWLSGGGTSFSIDMGGGSLVKVAARLAEAYCPVTPVEDGLRLGIEDDAGDQHEDTDEADLDDEEIAFLSPSLSPYLEADEA